MGRLSAEKGFDLLIQAVAELNEEGLHCRLQIAGDGDQYDALIKLITDLGCATHVSLLGHVSDVKTFFESLDVFVLSSLREGLPNVLLEAMALEVPVVSTRVAGVPNLIDSDKNGILVNSESVAELKQGIRVLALDPNRCRRLAVAGRQTIEDSFSFHRRMERVVELYDQSLGRR